jgi:hypothetical protein
MDNKQSAIAGKKNKFSEKVKKEKKTYIGLFYIHNNPWRRFHPSLSSLFTASKE